MAPDVKETLCIPFDKKLTVCQEQLEQLRPTWPFYNACTLQNASWLREEYNVKQLHNVGDTSNLFGQQVGMLWKAP